MQIFKGHTYGNDFLLTPLDETVGPAGRAELARVLCHRHHGVGADGLIFYTIARRWRPTSSFPLEPMSNSPTSRPRSGCRF